MQGNIERKCCLWQRKERINMDLLGKKVLVAGCGKSGLGAAGLLQKAGAVPVLFDENEKLDGKALCAREDYPKDTALVLGSLPKELLSELSLAVLSPGISIEEAFVSTLEEADIPVWGEIELAWNYEKGKVLAITGTNGKTTTTTLVGEILKRYQDNTFVVGIHGNFDQAQTGVKKMFSDAALAKEMEAAGYQFSSANSINIGRLVPQIVYYVYAYAKLYANGVIAKDEPVNVVVPTGNFGNILAAFYAKNMGIPIAKLICASNENKVLYDFFSTGTYDKNREFMLTSSPSMDILISSNLERLIYRIAGNDAEKNAALMRELTTTGKYEITPEMRAQLKDFYGNYTSETETAEVIRTLYEKTGYVIDTHTAVAAGVYGKYKKDTGDVDTKTVIASTASPFKFTRSVMDAIDHKYDSMSDFELVDELSRIANVAVPQAIEEIRNAKVLHDTVCEVDEMPQVVKNFLKI